MGVCACVCSSLRLHVLSTHVRLTSWLHWQPVYAWARLPPGTELRVDGASGLLLARIPWLWTHNISLGPPFGDHTFFITPRVHLHTVNARVCTCG